MPAKNLDYCFELEKELTRLREHFEYFKDSEPKELLDWARFFQKWGQRASDNGLAWVVPYVRLANMMVTDLSGKQPPKGAFDLILRAMRGAQRDMQREVDELQRPSMLMSA
jgi:hypothetical protein